MPPRSKDAIIANLKKELEAVTLEDRSTKSELSKANIDLNKNDTIVKDLQKMFSKVVQFHVGCRQRKKKHGKAGMILDRVQQRQPDNMLLDIDEA